MTAPITPFLSLRHKRESTLESEFLNSPLRGDDGLERPPRGRFDVSLGRAEPPPAQRETEADQTETEEQNGRGLRQDLSLGADRQIVYAEVPIGSHRAIEPPKS